MKRFYQDVTLLYKAVKNILGRIISRSIRECKYSYKYSKWRMKNPQNKTTISHVTQNISAILVGYYSYGELNVRSYDNPEEKLIIGNYVSIASNVEFILSGNHQITTFTSFPLKSILTNKVSPINDAMSKGAITIEDEVWIGANVVILSGVKVGRGAVIAAGSVVVKDIPDFAIVGGNPAKIIRFKHNEEIVKELKKIKLIDIPHEVLIKNMDIFYKPLTTEILSHINKLRRL